jgi:hypothetical protein
MLKKYCYLILVLTLFSCISLNAQTRAQCDSIIKEATDAYNKRDHARAMELYTQVHTIAEKKHWQKQLFWAKNGIGVTYYAMLDYGEAINYLLDGYTIAVKELEPMHEMTVLNNISLLYTKEKNFEKAKEFLKKAYDISKKINNNFNIGVFAINLANNANLRERPKETKIYVAEALKYLKDPGLINLGQMLLAESDLLEDKTAVAREKAQKLYNSVPDLKYNDIGISLMLIITKSYIAENQLELASENAQKIFTLNPGLETKRTVYGLLTDIYSKKGDYKAVAQYKDSILSAVNELNDLKNGRLYENSRVKFEIQNYKAEIAANEEKLQNERKFFYATLTIILSILIIIGLIFRNRSVKYKQKQILAERNQRITALELEKEKDNILLLERQISEREANSLLEEERLKNEIESRNRELSSKELYISGRNQLIEDILASFTQNPKLTRDRELFNHIRSLKSHVVSKNDWENFIAHFEQVNNGLLKRLQALHPSLTANDIRFIAYIYMNLTIKEIATILNITPIACGKRKERISAKLNLPKNVSLYTYLSGI